MKYWLERCITDVCITDASIDILALARHEMLAEFDRLKEDVGLPKSARPLWRLSWEYLVDDAPIVTSGEERK